MRDTSLLQLALGVAPPWTVVRSDFDTVARQLDIYIDFATGSRFPCPACGRRTARPTTRAGDVAASELLAAPGTI